MTILADVIDAMVAAGCTAKQLAAAIRADEKASQEKLLAKREKDRIRQRNHRARNAVSHVTERDNPNGLEGSTPPKTLNPSSPSSLRSSGDAPAHEKSLTISVRDELMCILDSQHSQAVIDHRKRLRKPLTAHAAHLLAGKFAACDDPNAAADAMISNGWQGFEPAWMQTRLQPALFARGPPQPRPKSEFQQHQDDVQAELDRALGRQRHDEFTGQTVDLGQGDFRAFRPASTTKP